MAQPDWEAQWELTFCCTRLYWFSLLLSPFVQAPHHYVPTLSSQWSHGSPPTSPRDHPLVGPHPRTCPCSRHNIQEAPSPHQARRLSASAASQKRNTAQPEWRSPDAAAPFSLRYSWWAWRRSSRSRSTCQHPIGQYSLETHTWLALTGGPFHRNVDALQNSNVSIHFRLLSTQHVGNGKFFKQLLTCFKKDRQSLGWPLHKTPACMQVRYFF